MTFEEYFFIFGVILAFLFFFLLDIKECEEGACEQSCEESVGSYSCSCGQGYTKDVDGHCKAPGWFSV